MTASVDANVLLRATLVQDEDQSARAQALLEQPGAAYVVSDAAIIEFVFALGHHYNLSRTQISDMVEAVLSVESLRCHRDLVLAAIAHFTSHPQLSFEDCLMGEQARDQNALPLYTFDKKLARQHTSARLVPAAG